MYPSIGTWSTGRIATRPALLPSHRSSALGPWPVIAPTPVTTTRMGLLIFLNTALLLVPLPIMISRFWRLHEVARQGRREARYEDISGRLRTPHGGLVLRHKCPDHCRERHHHAARISTATFWPSNPRASASA